MKTAEQWYESFEAQRDHGRDDVSSVLIPLIRAIQDDAREDGRLSMTEARNMMRNDQVKRATAALARSCYIETELEKARACMRIADDASGSQADRCYARDNATEHRRIAEAYISLAQAMKA